MAFLCTKARKLPNPHLPDDLHHMCSFYKASDLNRRHSLKLATGGGHDQRLLLISVVIAVLLSAVRGAKCPMDLSYLQSMNWNKSSCEKNSNCCQTIATLFGVGLAQRLRDTSMFELPSKAVASACVRDFSHQVSLASPAIPLEKPLKCFGDGSGFVSSPARCAGIQTRRDWETKIGKNVSIDTACRGDLSDLMSCNACKESADEVQRKLMDLNAGEKPDVETSVRCYSLVLFYAAGVANILGPTERGTATCVLKVPFASSIHHRATVILYGSLSGTLALLAVALGVYISVKYRRLSARKRKAAQAHEANRKYLMKRNTGAIHFTLAELNASTGNFHKDRVIGAGGFGTVFRGTLADGREIAVKEIQKEAGEGCAESEFLNEVEVINSIRHRNLVVLRGWCADPDSPRRFLVYDYMPNGSLEEHVFGRRRPLSWDARWNILVGVARGLCYLHESIDPAIFHRDIKPTNILLDEDMNPCIADFGLARLTNAGESHLTTRVAGTHGYLAPEYALYGHLTDRSDVYSFGVLVLEVISGRRALDSLAKDTSDYLIAEWAWKLLKAGKWSEIIDEKLREEWRGDKRKERKMERFVRVGILCSHVMVAFRPRMSEALKMLLGELEMTEIPDRPAPFCSPPSLSLERSQFQRSSNFCLLTSQSWGV